MRIGLVRGPNLNPWELANYADVPGVVAFGSRRSAFAAQRLDLPVRRLASPADLIARLPRPAPAAAVHFGGNLDHLIGLERAVRGFDVVHTAELSTGYSGQAITARSAGACKRVVTTIWENIPSPRPANAVVARRVRAVAAGVDHCLAISEGARLHLELAGVPADRIEVLPMGVDVTRFAPRTGSANADAPLRVLCVNRLVSEKGVDDVVLAAALLCRTGVPVEVTMVGEGRLGPTLRALADRHGVALDLRGHIPYEDIPGVQAAHDVFVLASGPRETWREQFGFAVVEAMASGLPVLAGDSGSLDEVVGDPEQLFRPHDVRALADHLGRLFQNPDRRARLGERNRRFALERYDRRRVGEQLETMYERVLARPARQASPPSSAS